MSVSMMGGKSDVTVALAEVLTAETRHPPSSATASHGDSPPCQNRQGKSKCMLHVGNTETGTRLFETPTFLFFPSLPSNPK